VTAPASGGEDRTIQMPPYGNSSHRRGKVDLPVATRRTITLTNDMTLVEVQTHLLILGLELSIRRAPASFGRDAVASYNAVVDSASNGHVGRGSGKTFAEAISNAIEDWQK